MPRTEAEKARLIEKDKPIITDELKSQDKKKIKHNVDKSRLIGERQSNLNKQDKHTTEGNFTPMKSHQLQRRGISAQAFMQKGPRVLNP